MSLPPPSSAQARIIWFACTGLALLTIVGVIIAAVWGMGKVLHVLAPVLWPLAIAGVLAYLLDPVVDWLQHKGIPRTRAILLVFFAVTGLLLAVLSSVIPGWWWKRANWCRVCRSTASSWNRRSGNG